uniref:Uncharacterized protein n=1 Tax=Rhizophagus irregularis (strain DAOM 181602 / DAOM 197198 / MUCL 43194) TaxID=747089 RepID=U9UML6_RHIID
MSRAKQKYHRHDISRMTQLPDGHPDIGTLHKRAYLLSLHFGLTILFHTS